MSLCSYYCDEVPLLALVPVQSISDPLWQKLIPHIYYFKQCFVSVGQVFVMFCLLRIK